jgi:replicative DNA helicase
MATAPALPAPEPQLPQNIDAEAALLGALMIDNRLVEQINFKLQAEHFFEPLHGRIFVAILNEVSRGRRATPVTLKPYFSEDADMKTLGGVSYLAQLTGSGAAVIGARDFANQVLTLAQLRAMINVGREIAARAADTSEATSFTDIVAFAESEIAAVSLESADGTVECTIGEAADKAMKASEDTTARVRSGIDPVDAALGPLIIRDLTIVAGRPGMGKSVLAQNYGRGASERKHGVLLVSLEMGAEQIGARALSEMTFRYDGRAVPLDAVLSPNKSREQIRRLFEAKEQLDQLPFQVVDETACTVTRLNSLVRRWKRRMAAKGVKLELVIVDYLQLMIPDFKVRGGDRTEAITYISQGLKRTAKTNDVHVMALSQLSRAVEQREDKRPHLSDLRDSGSIEQDADNVLFLFRPEYYLRASEPPLGDDKRPQYELLLDACKNRIEFICGKRRMGEAGKAFGEFHGAFQAIRAAQQ